jgi:hypothetical protein
VAERYRTADGWSVQVVHLSATPGKRDGEWLRVSYCGFWVADVRSVAEIEQWVSREELQSELALSRRCWVRHLLLSDRISGVADAARLTLLLGAAPSRGGNPGDSGRALHGGDHLV